MIQNLDTNNRFVDEMLDIIDDHRRQLSIACNANEKERLASLLRDDADALLGGLRN
jgi:hypothetical protein